MAKSSSKRSIEFIEGYLACSRHLSRFRNPYRALVLTQPVQGLQKFQEWHDGWNKRFWNEGINSPDPA